MGWENRHAGCSGGQKALAIGPGVVDTGAFQHQIDVQRVPVDAFGRRAAEHFDDVIVDMQKIAFDPHFAGKPAMVWSQSA